MYIGIDIGSVSSKAVILDDGDQPVFTEYLLNRGNPIGAVRSIVESAARCGFGRYHALCTTGSGRKYIGELLGADLAKNEITSTWKAAVALVPGARTIIEIGGQDSKLITIDNGEIANFRLNSVCAAGTGSFIEQQAGRLGLSLGDLSRLALEAEERARFSGRCTVFVETEMINLQQRGYPIEAIASGLIDAICENYLNDLSPGMRIEEPVLFCGGVSQMEAVPLAMEKKLGVRIIVPENNRIMAALGAAMLAKEKCRDPEQYPVKELSFTPGRIRLAPPPSCDKSECLDCGVCFGREQRRV
jgi:predicted CoA-substrate-specific enzyme activase